MVLLKKNEMKVKVMLLLAIAISFMSCGGDSSEPQNQNSKPTASDDTLTVEEDSASGAQNQIDVSANDTIGNDGGGNDDFNLKSDPDNGTVTEVSDGVFEYIPNTDFFGEDSFTYTLTDKDGDDDTATVKVTVNKFVPSAEAFNNINPDFPSFVSIDDNTPEGKKWVKNEDMSDEFDSWNPSKWFKSTWNYGVPVFMSTSSDNSGVTDGKLWIKATLNESNPEDRWFQTARIHTVAEIGYPMYTEASIKTSHISGFNTYWLNNGNIDNRDEIDIIENNSNPSCDCKPEFPLEMHSTYHNADENKTPQAIRKSSNYPRANLSETNPMRDKGWNEGYHTYGAWWKDSKNIQFYLDGEPAGSVVVGEHWDGETYEREFTRDLQIIFDLWTVDEDWIGGLALKSDLADDSKNTMRVDWVRTWKLEDE